MNRILFSFLCLFSLTGFAANPSFQSFDTNSFQVIQANNGIGAMIGTNLATGSLTNRNQHSGIVFESKTNGVTTFRWRGNGDLDLIKSVGYLWPSAHGVATSVLTDTDGAGTLAWMVPSGGGGGATNVAIRPGPGITVTTNAIGSDFTVNNSAPSLWTNDLDGPIRILRPIDQTRMVEVFHVGTNTIAVEGLIQNTNAAAYSQAGYFENLGTNSGPGSLVGANGGSFGLLGESSGSLGALTGGDGIGVQGVADSGFNAQYGIQGEARAQFNTQTNIGGGFSASSNGKTGTTNVGIYAETQTGSVAPTRMQSAVALFDNRDSGLPPTIWRTNLVETFEINSNGLPQLLPGKSAGAVLTSDANGVGTWQPAGGSGVGPGTLNHLSMFNSTTTNVIDSNLIQEATNQWAYKQSPSTYTNSVSNIWYSAWTSTSSNKGLEIDINSASTDVAHIRQFRNGAVGSDVFGGISFNDAWLINGSGTVASGGHNGDLFPAADDALVIGSGAFRIKSITTGSGGVLVATSSSVPQLTWSSGFGFGGDATHIYIYDTDHSTKQAEYDASQNPSGVGFQWDMGLGGIAGGGSPGSPISHIYSAPGNVEGWMVGTNSNAAARPPTSRIFGSIATGTDHSGGDIFLVGGKSSGLGTNGSVGFQTASAASSTSSSTNQPYTRMFVSAEPTVLTTNSATGICTITLPTSLTSFGCKVFASTHVDNGTDGTDVTEEIFINSINKAGTVTTHVSSPANTTTISTGSSGCTTAWTATVSSTTVTIKVNATTTGQLDTVSTCRWQVQLNSGSVSVVTPL